MSNQFFSVGVLNVQRCNINIYMLYKSLKFGVININEPYGCISYIGVGLYSS